MGQREVWRSLFEALLARAPALLQAPPGEGVQQEKASECLLSSLFKTESGENFCFVLS